MSQKYWPAYLPFVFILPGSRTVARGAIVPRETAQIAPLDRAKLRAIPPPEQSVDYEMAYWLMKSEPDVYSIDDLERDGREMWDSIRNYQARNMMRDDMVIGDEVFFYHSNCKEPGIVGIMKVASEPYPDPVQFDKKSNYYDPKSSKKEPRWVLVDVEFVRKLKRNITLTEIKADKRLEDMTLTRRGNRLSIMPIEKKHWNRILSLE
jgi:predicted RNA-binding protein with PUA-like domain